MLLLLLLLDDVGSRPVSHWIVADLNTVEGRALLSAAIKQLVQQRLHNATLHTIIVVVEVMIVCCLWYKTMMMMTMTILINIDVVDSYHCKR